jgi:hypothetical protein
MQDLEVTVQNLQLCKSARDALRANLETLAKLTKKYPVECRFAGFRFVFESRADIDAVIATLETGIARLEAA